MKLDSVISTWIFFLKFSDAPSFEASIWKMFHSPLTNYWALQDQISQLKITNPGIDGNVEPALFNALSLLLPISELVSIFVRYFFVKICPKCVKKWVEMWCKRHKMCWMVATRPSKPFFTIYITFQTTFLHILVKFLLTHKCFQIGCNG